MLFFFSLVARNIYLRFRVHQLLFQREITFCYVKKIYNYMKYIYMQYAVYINFKLRDIRKSNSLWKVGRIILADLILMLTDTRSRPVFCWSMNSVKSSGRKK